MKRFIIILWLAAFLVWSALLTVTAYGFDKWETTDYALGAAYLSLHCVDWVQTRNIAANPDKYYERNNYMSMHPTMDQVDKFFVVTTAIEAVMITVLPREVEMYGYKVPVRNIYQCVRVLDTANTVRGNVKIKLGIGYRMGW